MVRTDAMLRRGVRPSCPRAGAAAAALIAVTAAFPVLAFGMTGNAAKAAPLRFPIPQPPPQAACRYSGWSGDGCRASQGSFLIADHFQAQSFYDFAAQSGQTWAGGAHPWSWNSPGIDYPIGPAADTQLQDPATALLPKGCGFSPKGSAIHGPEIRCGPLAKDPVIFGVDFSLHGCTRLSVDSRGAGLVTVAHSRFRNGPNCGGAQAAMIRLLDGRSGLSLTNDVIDLDFPSHDAPLVAVGESGAASGPFILTYSVVLNGPPRPLSGNFAGPVAVENSVSIGPGIATSDTHGLRGELCEYGCPIHPTRYASVTFRNNVLVVTTSTRLSFEPPPDALTAVIRPPSDAQFATDHSVYVVNYPRGPLVTVASHLSGRVEGGRMTLSPDYTGVVAAGDILIGLPDGHDVNVLARLGNGDFALSGVMASGPFKDVSAVRETTLAALVRVSYSAVYPNASIKSNYYDTTGGYSCVKDFGSVAGSSVVFGNLDLRSGLPISGIGVRSAANACPADY